MQYDFLKAFPRRMKNIGLHALIVSNSGQKAIWKDYGFETMDQQLNMVYSVLLFIMEQSLKEENCTIDDISAFIDNINTQYFRKSMTYEDCSRLADFIVNIVLSNEGKSMHMDGYNYENMEYEAIHISYIANRIVYLDQEVRRTSYYLTDDGYNLLLGTLEVENNMKLTIQEMIFKMHLDKQSYDKALDDIRNVFNLLRIQMQKIYEAMGRVRRNALDYNVEDYRRLLEEDLNTIDQTEEKFRGYRETVRMRVKELEDSHIEAKDLTAEDEEKLENLREIEVYLQHAIDEHQRILGGHFDLKTLYTEELEKIAEMSTIQRFSLRTEVVEKVLNDVSTLDRLHMFLRPLFNQNPEKVFNLNKILEIQKVHTGDEGEEGSEDEDLFDEEAWKKEQEQKRREKMRKYEGSLAVVLNMAAESGQVELRDIQAVTAENSEQKQQLIPNISIFREIMVELLKSREIDIVKLRAERASFIQEECMDFQLNKMLLSMLDGNPDWKNVVRIEVVKTGAADPVVFGDVTDEDGNVRNIRCSNVSIKMVRGGRTHAAEASAENSRDVDGSIQIIKR